MATESDWDIVKTEVSDDGYLPQHPLCTALARLEAEHNRLKNENAVLRESVGPLAEALRNLLLSRDVAWDGKGLGHDWDEAVKAAAEALEMKP